MRTTIPKMKMASQSSHLCALVFALGARSIWVLEVRNLMQAFIEYIVVGFGSGQSDRRPGLEQTVFVPAKVIRTP